MSLKLGEIVSDIEFSEEEKARITESFRARSGNPYSVLQDSYLEVREMDFWSHAHKLLAIKGYRPGKAKDQIFRRCLDAIDERGSKANVVLWRLYRRCIHQHMMTDLSLLNTLLLKEDAPGNFDQSTESIFRAILRVAPLYEVPNEQVKMLYDIWAFARFDGFESLFEKSGSDFDVVRRLVSQEIGNASKKIYLQIDSSGKELRVELERIKTEIKQMGLEIRNLDGKIANSVSVVRSEMQNLAATTVNKKIGEVSASLKKSLSQTTKTNASNAGLSDEVLKMQDQLGKLTKHVASLSASLPTESSMAAVTDRFESPISTESFKKWCQQLSALGIKNCEAFGIVAIGILRSSSILILDRAEVLTTLLGFILGKESVRIRAANPLWISPASWTDDFSWATEDSPEPRALILCDFDVPIQEVYLVPALVEWRAKSPYSQNRIILVRSSASTPTAKRLFELSLEIPEADYFDFSNIDAPTISPAVLDEYFKIGIANSKPSPSANSDEEHLKLFARNNELRMSSDLTSAFARLSTSLEAVFSHDAAFQTAISVSILNWIDRVSGNARRQLFEERLRAIFAESSRNG